MSALYRKTLCLSYILYRTPFNGETPLALLADNLITPNELFFIRNHLPVPKLDEEHFRLEIEVSGNPDLIPVELTIDDIKNKIPKTSVVSVVQVLPTSLYSVYITIINFYMKRSSILAEKKKLRSYTCFTKIPILLTYNRNDRDMYIRGRETKQKNLEPANYHHVLAYCISWCCLVYGYV